jgi:predicted ATPase
LVLWLLGYVNQAQQRSQEALTLARELSHPYTLAEALGYATWLRQFRREGSAVREVAETVITLAQEQGFAYWLAQGRMLRGWALTVQGQGRQGLPEMRQGLADHRATGSEAARPYYLALLAEAYKHMAQPVAQPAEGLNVLCEALEIVREAEVCFYAAEVHRLQGELLLLQAAGRTEPESVVAAHRAATEGTAAVGWDLQLVHRGV